MKQQRKVIPFTEPQQPENVIEFPKQPGQFKVIVKPRPCDDLPRRLLQVYRLFGYTGEEYPPTSAASAENTNDTLIHDADLSSGGTA